MADSQWTRKRVARVLGRVTRGALLSVGALTVAGFAAASLLSKVSLCIQTVIGWTTVDLVPQYVCYPPCSKQQGRSSPYPKIWY